jgi:hypothetical protein
MVLSLSLSRALSLALALARSLSLCLCVYVSPRAGNIQDFVSDPKSWRGQSPVAYKNPGPYKQPNVGSDGFGGSSEGRQR